MTAAEARARRVRDNLREEKQRLAVVIADTLFGGGFPQPDIRREYRVTDRRLAAAHRKLIALIQEREKAAMPATVPPLSLKRNHGNPTTTSQDAQGIPL